jgi:hypothetical protein
VLLNRELTGAVTIEDTLSHRVGIPLCDNASLSWRDKSNSDYSAISPLVLLISLSTFLQSDGTKLLTLLAGDHADTPAATTRKLRHFPLALKHYSRVPTHSLYLHQYYVRSSAGPHRDAVTSTAIQRPERANFLVS